MAKTNGNEWSTLYG